jgi:hypothetical protein
MSITSNFNKFANRRSLANLSMAQKQIAPTTTIVRTAIKTKIIAPPFVLDLRCFALKIAVVAIW